MTRTIATIAEGAWGECWRVIGRRSYGRRWRLLADGSRWTIYFVR